MIPNNELEMVIQISSLNAFGNEVSFVKTPTNITLVGRPCLQGEEFTSEGKCILCPPGFYLYDASL